MLKGKMCMTEIPSMSYGVAVGSQIRNEVVGPFRLVVVVS